MTYRPPAALVAVCLFLARDACAYSWGGQRFSKFETFLVLFFLEDMETVYQSQETLVGTISLQLDQVDVDAQTL